jgi:hypothetical protein
MRRHSPSSRDAVGFCMPGENCRAEGEKAAVGRPSRARAEAAELCRPDGCVGPKVDYTQIVVGEAAKL